MGLLMISEKTRLPPEKVLDAVKRGKPADVVVVVLDGKGDVKVHGSSGGEVSAWMLKAAEKVIKNVKRRKA